MKNQTDDGTLPQKVLDVFDMKTHGFLATIGADGMPQVTPVWVGIEDGRIRVNTAAGRVKHGNMERDPRVTLAAHAPDDPFLWVSVQGRATMTTEGADEHIDRLAKKYLGKDRYPWHSDKETRVTVDIEPTRIVTS